ncbi:hypothetical protein [Sphingomonas sp. T1]|uniref:hypothetical protein n=1 Tax=Sphingomonas sp. T1 TaxID=2653172 RepID=UPI001357EE55|nr:hypothetical protein [Sphingomonas sp. T1]
MADALIMRAGYAVTGAAYRPLAWRGRSWGKGGARSFASRHAARGFAVAIVDNDCGHTRSGDAINQAIGLLVLIAGPIAGDVDAIVANFECQVRNGGIEVEQPRHVGLDVERDVPEIMAGQDELPGAGAIIEAHGLYHPVVGAA